MGTTKAYCDNQATTKSIQLMNGPYEISNNWFERIGND